MSHRSSSNRSQLPIDFKRPEPLSEPVEQSQDSIIKQNQSSISQPSNSYETKSKQSFLESQSTLNSPSNLSTKTGQSTTSTNQHPINPSIDSNLSTKFSALEHMSTVYEESEPSSTISLSHSTLRKDGIIYLSYLFHLFSC